MIEILKHLSFSKIVKFTKLFFAHPLLIFPAFWASFLTLIQCQKEFGNAQYLTGKANAYRHALWIQYLLYYSRFSKQNENWVRNFTLQYENTFINSAPNQAMDIHNNEVSVLNYKENLPKSTQEIKAQCTILMSASQKISESSYRSEIENFPEQLVYF